jgi:hypothetical protein
MPKFTEEDVELAERYAAALERIKALEDVFPSEDDAKAADDYLATLQGIENIGTVFDEDDAKAADEHLATLRRIEELADKD